MTTVLTPPATPIDAPEVLPTGTLTTSEQVWRGVTGEAYHADPRHRKLSKERAAFWGMWANLLDPQSILEVGCGTGCNLEPFTNAPLRVGLDVSSTPLAALRTQGRGLPCVGSARVLPFWERSFDLVITAGCLIHLHWEALQVALMEIGRVAAKDVLLLEYDDGGSHVPLEQDKGGPAGVGERDIPWRGFKGLCWARPYGLLFWRTPVGASFSPMGRADLTAQDGWDRVTLAWFRRRTDRRA